MKMEEQVPITTPRIMAKAKLRILSPPKKKIHNNTTNVVNEVLMVRVNVVFKRIIEQT